MSSSGSSCTNGAFPSAGYACVIDRSQSPRMRHLCDALTTAQIHSLPIPPPYYAQQTRSFEMFAARERPHHRDDGGRCWIRRWRAAGTIAANPPRFASSSGCYEVAQPVLGTQYHSHFHVHLFDMLSHAQYPLQCAVQVLVAEVARFALCAPVVETGEAAAGAAGSASASRLRRATRTMSRDQREDRMMAHLSPSARRATGGWGNRSRYRVSEETDGARSPPRRQFPL
jgi:hypothetical protein